MKLGIIGCGNMGLTYAKSFLNYDLVKSEELFLYEKDFSKINNLDFGTPSELAKKHFLLLI